MGTQQILRAVALLAVTSVSASASADARPVTVVELAGDRAPALRSQLRAAGFAVMSAPDLDAATSGIDAGIDLRESLAALDQTRQAFGALDCAATIAAAERALAILAARAAAGVEVTAELSSAWSYLLLCRDRSADFDGAMRAAQAMRALAAPGDPMAALDAALWTKYPAVDVTANRDIAKLAITAEPGAVVMIDHQRVGASPVTAFVPVGRHLIAAALASRRTSQWIDVAASTGDVSLRLVEQDAPLSRVSERVASWRELPVTGPQAAAFLEDLLVAAQGQPWNPGSARSPLLVVVGIAGDPRRIQVWASNGPAQLPTATEIALDLDAPQPLIAALGQRDAAWTDRAPDVVLVTDKRTKPVSSVQRQQWWVYAALAGAAMIGGAIVIANETSNNLQRVELRVP